MSSGDLTPSQLATLLDMLRDDCPLTVFAIGRRAKRWVLVMEFWRGQDGTKEFAFQDFDNWLKLADAVRIEYGWRSETIHAH